MDKISNNLSNAQAERLAILVEELGEAQQAVGKILRHGYNSCSPFVELDKYDNPVTNNRQDLEKELGHVLFSAGMLIAGGDIENTHILSSVSKKAESIKPYLHFQED